MRFDTSRYQMWHHQGLNGKLIVADALAADSKGEIRCRERLGGMLHYYYRDAA